MKNLILFVLLSLLNSDIAYSQLKIRMGAEADLLVNNATSKSTEDIGIDIYKNLYGPAVGFITEIAFGEQLAVQPGVFYKMMGFRQKYSIGFLDETIKADIKVRMNTLTVPVPFVFKFGNNKQFFAGLGPEFQYILSGTGKGKVEYTDVDGTISEEVNESIEFDDPEAKRFIIAGMIMAGYEHTSGLYAKAFFSHGITKFFDSAEEGNTRLNHFGIGVGYFFLR